MKIIGMALGLFLVAFAVHAGSVCVVDLKDSSNQWREACDGESETRDSSAGAVVTRVSKVMKQKLDDGYRIQDCVGMGDDQQRCIFVKD